MHVTPAIRSEGFYLGDQFGLRVFPSANRFANPKSCVLLLHGFPAWNTKNEDIAIKLALCGHATYIIHHKGLGESQGKFDFNTVVEETRANIKYLCKLHQCSKIHLIGHSFGGFLTLALKDLAASISLICPLFDIEDKESMKALFTPLFQENSTRIVQKTLEELESSLNKLAELYPKSELKRGIDQINTFLAHGTKDDIIPLSSSIELKKSLGAKATYLEFVDDHWLRTNRRSLSTV